MSATNTFETSLLSLIFENQNGPANVGDTTGLRGSTTAGSFWISLHTSTGPADTGDQTTNEATYTGYARKSVNRDGSSWNVASGVASNAAAITFDPCTGGTNTVTQFGIGHNQTTAGTLHFWGDLSADLAVSNGITPAFGIDALQVTLD